jgi:hypothetical protein
MDKKVILFIILSKVLIFLIIVIGFFNFPFKKINYEINFHYPQNEPVTLQTAFKTWDSQHYLFLSQFGYKPDQYSNGFFPLFPLLIRIFTPIFNSPLVAGLVISNVLSTIAIIYFYLFVKDYFNNNSKTALWSVVSLLIFPTSFYLSLVYSESVFLCLSIPMFYYLYKGQYKWASIFAFLIPFSRPVGIFVAIPFAYFFLSKAKLNWHSLNWKYISNNIPEIRKLFYIPIPLLGFVFYCLTMYVFTGSFLAGYIAQEANAAGWHSGIELGLFFRHLFASYNYFHYNDTVHDRLFFLFFIVSIYFIYKNLIKLF